MSVYLDDGDDVRSGRLKFGDVDVEMIELVFLRLFQDNGGTITYGMDAAQIGGGVQGRVRGLSDGHLGNGGGQATAFVTGRSERSVGIAGRVDGDKGFLFILVTLDRGLRVALEETHCAVLVSEGQVEKR